MASEIQDDDQPELREIPSELRRTLAGGRRDLWRARLPFYISPLRDYLMDPAFLFSSAILPPVANAFHVDRQAAVVVNFTSLVPMRFFLNLVETATADDEPQGAHLTRSARNDILLPSAGLPRIRPPSDFSSAVRGGFAFACSAASDVIGAVMNPRKMKKWMDSLGQFRAYLHSSGVGAELEESMMKPLFRGRLLDNIKILNDIQEIHDTDRATGCRNPSYESMDTDLSTGARLMRFSTAAYGTEMIRSALDGDAVMEQLETERSAIAFHTKLEPKEVEFIFVPEGGDMRVLRHYIAVDHVHKEVVLALRGTLSISGALVDMQAMDCDYCRGRAHKGIAEVSTHLWNASGQRIKDLMEKYSEYEFIVTGHSLGGGAACLLHVKIHVENLLPNRVAKCYAFAPPPTFCLKQNLDDKVCMNAIQKARENCVCYIHDNDCVPFLSVSSIRRLSNLLDAVDNKTEFIWFWKRFRIFWEFDPIPKPLVDSVVETGVKGNEKALEGELVIPARIVIWMKKNFAGKFEAIGCSPEAVAGKNIFMTNDMMTDHLPEQYEDAFDDLTSEKC